MRRKDVVLMATVTSFEELERPTKSELRQFAELFTPLFQASGDEARRQAVAALSRSLHIPPAVAFFIASQPVSVAAPFLIGSACLTDEMLITIARTQGADHARAIVRRENLSPKVIDALVGLRHARRTAPGEPAQDASANRLAGAEPTLSVPAKLADGPEEARLAREEALRQQIKGLAAHLNRAPGDRLGLRSLTEVQEALLVRFARERDADSFATTLADTLSASRWLAERILLDVSGHQLATTLKGLAMGETEALFVLERFYTHLKDVIGDTTRGQILWDSLEEDECGRRLEAWRRADRYTYAEPVTPTVAETSVPQTEKRVAGLAPRFRVAR
ncbi:Uncharacterized conserved protein, DUF2336 family [Rhizobium sp. RU35A]|uniref:DUF2336 domain-containing protein n=1 Tax=Rhizobium sp. RU35A TaxID=1907414 RepID=UPI0009553028|nr:DUF2336 domain-containing protein [Rhizobium sp. RU35A]SIP94800.1 Uncharacterized conserved protein, DUF2336 family [Rhizobium sp. RU35A]